MSARRFTDEELVTMRQLHVKGRSIRAIARHFNCSEDSVTYRLDIGNTRKRARDRVKRNRYQKGGGVQLFTAKPITPKLAPPEIKMAAVRAFAAGKINRVELMKRISP